MAEFSGVINTDPVDFSKEARVGGRLEARVRGSQESVKTKGRVELSLRSSIIESG